MNSLLCHLKNCGNTRHLGNTRQIVSLLKAVGVPRHMLHIRRPPEAKSFWLRRINHLEVLEQARQLYRSQIVEVHPDKAGGCLERTIQLNRAWSEIQRRFKNHGRELY